jgi:hypothetical protein
MTDNLIIWLALLTLGVGIGLFVILMAAAKVVRAVREIKGSAEAREIKPQPLVVKADTEFARKDDLDRVEERLEKLETQMDQKLRRVHGRLTRLLAGQYLIAGQQGIVLDKHSEQLDRALQKIARDEEGDDTGL